MLKRQLNAPSSALLWGLVSSKRTLFLRRDYSGIEQRTPRDTCLLAAIEKPHLTRENRGTPGGIRTPNLLIRSYLLELKLMRFPQLNRVSRCQEESGEVANVGLVTDILTDIMNFRGRKQHSQRGNSIN